MCTSEQRDHCGERGGGPSQDRLVDLDARPGRAASIAPPFRRLSAFPVGCTTQPQTLGILPTLCPRLLSDLQARAKSKATAQPPKSGKDSVSAVLSHWLGPGCFTGSPGKSHKNQLPRLTRSQEAGSPGRTWSRNSGDGSTHGPACCQQPVSFLEKKKKEERKKPEPCLIRECHMPFVVSNCLARWDQERFVAASASLRCEALQEQ